MKKFAIALLCLLTLSCTDNFDTEDPKYLTKKDVSGVWVNPSNELYFISLGENGRYTLCLDRYTMSSGTYELDKDIISLHNGYLYTSDNLSIEIKENKLVLKGYMAHFKSNTTKYINMTLTKSSESISPSMVGVVLESSGGSLSSGGKYLKRRRKVQYTTDCVATYKQEGLLASTQEWVNIEEITWFYVFRSPNTYVQSPNGNGEVTIYCFGNLGWTDLNRYIVEQ